MSQTAVAGDQSQQQTTQQTTAQTASASTQQETTQAQSSSTATTDPFASITREDIKAHLKSTGYKTIEDALTADMHAQRMVGMDKNLFLRVPKGGREADPEAWGAVMKALGVPEKPDGYGQFQPATGALALAPEALSGFDKAMHEAGATPATRNAALKYYHEASAAAAKADDDAYAADVNKGLVALKGEWGAQYDAYLAAGEAAAKAVLGEDFAKFLKDARLDDHPTVKRAFFALAKATAEDGRIGAGRTLTAGETPDEAKRKIAEIEKNPALFDTAHMDHASVKAERARLYALAFPNT